MSPYYDEDGITIYHGDARELLPPSGLIVFEYELVLVPVPDSRKEE